MGAANEGLDILGPHLEFDDDIHPPEVPDTDVCICAGDILDGGTRSERRLARAATD